jgi:carboxymethylenebutenolidase
MRLRRSVTAMADTLLPVPYFLARPDPGNVRPGVGVVVVHEGNGISPQLLRVCERIAREGYLVAAPDLFHGFGGPNPEGGGTPYLELRVPDGLRDIAAVVAELRGLGAERIGITGFCMGGRYSYETAISGIDVQAAVPFYGGGIAGHLGEPTCPTLMLFGGRDDYIPTADIDKVVEHHPGQVVVYADAGHGFFRDGSDSYNEGASTDAWKRLTEFFAEHLR